MIPSWTERNKYITKHIPESASVIDWGCGDKDTLRYIQPKKYLGIDKNVEADIIADFNISIPVIEDHYEIGLVLGVLEYLNDPKHFLETIKSTADTFIILSLPNRKKPEWSKNFTIEEFQALLLSIWTTVSFEKQGGYIIGICK